MKITFDVVLEDLVAFNIHLVERLPSTHFSRAFATYFPAAALLGLAAYDFFCTEAMLWPGWLALAVLLLLLMPPFLRYLTHSHIRGLLAGGPPKGALGAQELELAERFLINRHPYGEQWWTFEAVERVEQAEGHVFIMLGELAAIVVPRVAVSPEELEAFLTLLKRALATGSGRGPSSEHFRPAGQ
jgi:hypothetical protein